jgi:cytochrome b
MRLSMTSPKSSILVWDLPLRLFHWMAALSFAGAWLTAETERWRLLHVTLGYTLAGLLVFRLLWGLIGTRHARFADFVRGPGAVRRYVVALLRGRPEHHVGHNPAGALAIMALLTLGSLSAVTGWAVYEQLGGDWLSAAHDIAASVMLAVVGVHLLGVVVASWLHQENLVASMITGRKAGAPEQGIRSAWRSVAALMLVAVMSYWWLQWPSAPDGVGADTSQLKRNSDGGSNSERR